MADSRKRTLPEAPPDRTVSAAFREADAFVRPGQQAVDGGATKTNPFEELAASLKSFKAGAAPILEAQRDFELEAEEASGKLKANKATFKELVDTGAISRWANPHFREAFQQQRARLVGDAFTQFAKGEYDKSDIRNSDDPAQVQAFLQKTREQFEKQNGINPAVLGPSYLDKAQAAAHSLTLDHIRQRAEAAEAEQQQMMEQETINTIDSMVAKGASPAQIAAALTARKDELIAAGGNGAKQTKALIDAITTKAKERNDPRLLQILDHVKTGTGKLSDTSYARERRLIANRFIDSERERMTAQADRAETRAREKAEREAGGEAILELLRDPHSPKVRALAEALAKVSPQKAQWIINQQRLAQEQAGKVVEDRDVVASLSKEANDPAAKGVTERTWEAYQKRLIDETTATRIVGHHEKVRSNLVLFNEDAWKINYSDLTKAITQNDFGKPLKPEQAARLNMATTLLQDWAMDRKRRMPDESPEEYFRWLRNMKDDLIKQFAPEVSKEMGSAEKKAEPPKALPRASAPPKWMIEFLKKHRDNPAMVREFERRNPGVDVEAILKGNK